MKERYKKIYQSKFVRNVMILVTGTAAAQAIALLFTPIITRLYGPESFGLMGTFMAIVSIVAPIAALTYPIAIVLPKTDKEAKAIIGLSLRIIAFLSILSLIILMLFNKQIANIFNLKEISSYLYLIPLVIVFSGVMEIAEQWLIRTKQYTINARVTFLHALVLNGSKAGFGVINPIASVLIILSALGNGLKAGLMIYYIKKSNYQSKKDLKNSDTNIKKIARKYNDFPKYRAPQVFLNGISQGLPVLLLTSFFGPVSAGLYTIGRTVLSAPTQLIGKAVGDVFYPRISEAANNGENLTEIIKKATLALAIIGIVPFGLIMLFAPILFSFVFGVEWYDAGEYARWTALWVYFVFINQPSIKALPVLSGQGFHLKFTIISVIIRLLALILGYTIFDNDVTTVALFSISGAIMNIILIQLTMNISKKVNN